MNTIACVGNSDSFTYGSLSEVGKLLSRAGVSLFLQDETGAFEHGVSMVGGFVEDVCVTWPTEFAKRLGRLLEADGFIIVADGSPGTLVVLLAIIEMNLGLWKSNPKRLVIINPAAHYPTWSGRFIDALACLGITEEDLQEGLQTACWTRFPEKAAQYLLG